MMIFEGEIMKNGEYKFISYSHINILVKLTMYFPVLVRGQNPLDAVGAINGQVLFIHSYVILIGQSIRLDNNLFLMQSPQIINSTLLIAKYEISFKID